MHHTSPSMGPRPYVRSAPPPPRSTSFIPPARPHDEEARLAALHALDILDTAGDLRFDRITALVADLFGVPSALVSFVDENRQWFKSRCGLDASETPRDVSFCGHAILERSILVIEDARLDPRFAGNPLVTGAPFVRFYAGAVLRDASAMPLGTLCILDSSPRVFDRDDRRRLIGLAQLVEQELDHHTDVLRIRSLMARLG